ncbi:MAG: hypothetical protein ACUBOA_00065 [Candidatus Loosdrechtia sp.]|uniref:hypothetical protein n=1 Tax=Candidatus Loosdrechtia sp. TaxID=3101272 RepID=UPI003A7A1ACB|nr:MAG: hypothetical protein QY305_03745 [Candidatus Jettenia sp. AMX2]
MRKLISILFITMTAFTGVSHAHDSPVTVVEKYLDAVRNNEYDKAYSFISKTDTTIIRWLELIKYVKEITPSRLTRIIDLAHNAARQEIGDTSAGSNTAIVKIHSVVPDMEETLRITQDPEEIQFLFEHRAFPVKDKSGEFTLIVEDGEWKISRVKGVSSDQAADIATDFAELILGRDEAEEINEKINAFIKRQEKGT